MFREYYSQIETIINECPIVTHFSIEFDEIDTFVGYLKGTLELILDFGAFSHYEPKLIP